MTVFTILPLDVALLQGYEMPALPQGRKDDAGKPDWSLIPLWTLPHINAARTAYGRAKLLEIVQQDRTEPSSLTDVRQYLAEYQRSMIRQEPEPGYLAKALVACLHGLNYLKGGDLLIEGLCKVIPVLQFGANKYGRFNWLHVEPARYVASAARHLNAWEQGQTEDPESGFHPGRHVLACLLILLGLETLADA